MMGQKCGLMQVQMKIRINNGILAIAYTAGKRVLLFLQHNLDHEMSHNGFRYQPKMIIGEPASR